MPARPFGAVVRDVGDEIRNLITIQMRNARRSNNPLDPNFTSNLFGRIQRSPVYSLCDDWEEAVEALQGIITRALESHFAEPDGPYRVAYDWAAGEMTERWDFRASVQRTAMRLMARAGSIFQYADRGTNPEPRLLNLTRYWVLPRSHVTDAQLLALLSISEARAAAYQLGIAIDNVGSSDDVLAGLRDLEQFPELRAEVQRDLQDALHRAIRSGLNPKRAYITRCRVHAEKLLLLAELRAAGSISSGEAEKMLQRLEDSETARTAAEAAHEADRKRRLKGVTKGAEIARKLSNEDKALVIADAKSMRCKGGSLEKEIELALAEKHGVSRSTIQRALGKR